jgi:acetyl esterase/lipase
MSKYSIHKEITWLKFLTLPASPVIIPPVNAVLKTLHTLTRTDSDLNEQHIKLNTNDDESIRLTIYSPKNVSKSTPCLIYLYGSAYFMTPNYHHKKWAMIYAREARCKVVFVNYSLSPAHPFPTPFLDCYQAAEWVFDHAERLNIDPDRIAVGGDSSGGALAASVSIMRRDLGLKNFCFQFLIYPVTDGKMNSPSMMKFSDTPLWTSKLNKMMWSLYIKDPKDLDNKFAAPMEAVDFSSLPDAYIEVCEFDPLRDEGLLYADELNKAGIQTEVSLVPGAIHGFDMMMNTSLMEVAENRRIAALKAAFSVN